MAKVRLKDIARDLGISAMAVSKALRGHSDIGAETRERVARRAAELGYRVDWVARSMVTGRTFLVGLVVPDLIQSFFAEIAGALAEALAPAGYHLLIAHTREHEQDEREDIEVLVGRKVDGLIIASAQHEAAAMTNLRTPFVLIDRMVPGVNASYVGPSDTALGRMATDHLLARGCRRVAHLAGPNSSASAGRVDGYRAALTAAGISIDEKLVAPGGYDDAGGEAAMRMLLAAGPVPDGVFCFNDPVAIGAMRAILDAGLAVPSDVAVVGAANMRHSDMLRVPLSTIDQDTGAIAARAAELLLAAMADPAAATPRRIETPLRLIARASSLR